MAKPELVNPSGQMIRYMQEIIANDLMYLREHRIGLIGWEGTKKKNGRRVLCTTEMVNEKSTFLLAQHGDEHAITALISIDAGWWVNEAANNNARRACMCEALCGLQITKNGLALNPPDFFGYTHVVQKYGFWRSDLRDAAKVVQYRMDLGDVVSRGGVIPIQAQKHIPLETPSGQSEEMFEVDTGEVDEHEIELVPA